MEVTRFTDQYDMIAEVYGTTAAELRARDSRQTQPVQRWVAIRDGAVVAAVSTRWRPDDRTFLSFTGRDRSAYPVLADAVIGGLGRSLHTFAEASDDELVQALQLAGFETELVEERFRIRFDAALAALRRSWIPTGFSIIRADAADENQLFELDNALRPMTLGTDGWQGDRAWFRDEFSESPPFDPSAYLVAVDDRRSDYVGLVRIWRNPDAPRFGLVGVLPPYRTTTIAGALLRTALLSAAEWGHDTFTAETSPSNPVIYRRMSRLGAESQGQFFQMVRRP